MKKVEDITLSAAGSLARVFQTVGQRTARTLYLNKVFAAVMMPVALLSPDTANYIAPVIATTFAFSSNQQTKHLSMAVDVYDTKYQEALETEHNDDKQLLLGLSKKVSGRLKSDEGVSFRKITTSAAALGAAGSQFIPDIIDIASHLIKNVSLQNIVSTAFTGLVLFTNDRSITKLRKDIASYAGLEKPEQASTPAPKVN